MFEFAFKYKNAEVRIFLETRILGFYPKKIAEIGISENFKNADFCVNAEISQPCLNGRFRLSYINR